jgi:hypothetical protein
MNKNDILMAIKRIAQDNSGKPPGQEKFSRETGVTNAKWSGRYWIRWSEALAEAGFKPNAYKVAYDDSFLLEKLAQLTHELGRFPVGAELKLKARSDIEFPNHNAFDRLGAKNEKMSKLRGYCAAKPALTAVMQILGSNNEPPPVPADASGDFGSGFVYLIKHGSRHEYKVGRTNNRLRREGEISIELPERLTPVHSIETDDPSGVEAYWHRRFSGKRKNGEWFSLSADEVRAFKRWKRIF